MNRNHKICQEAVSSLKGFPDMFPVFFPVSVFQYLLLLEIKSREGGFEPKGFFCIVADLFRYLPVFSSICVCLNTNKME